MVKHGFLAIAISNFLTAASMACGIKVTAPCLFLTGACFLSAAVIYRIIGR